MASGLLAAEEPAHDLPLSPAALGIGVFLLLVVLLLITFSFNRR
jgi:hypothetical protein